MQRGLVAVLVLAAPLLAVGCTVPSHGVAGIGLDSGGRIIGYLLTCSHHLDGATVYDADADQERSGRLGSWTAPHPVTDFASWPLESLPPGWTADPPLGRLLPATTYSLYGWTSDNSSSAVGVDFTLEQLATLKPGQVRFWPGTDSHGDGYRAGSVEEFRQTACAAVG